MARNVSRAVRKREIIDAVFICNRGGFMPTLYQIAKLVGMSRSPHLKEILAELTGLQVLYAKLHPYRSNSNKYTYSVNMLGLLDVDPDHYRKIRCHWPTMFPDDPNEASLENARK